MPKPIPDPSPTAVARPLSAAPTLRTPVHFKGRSLDDDERLWVAVQLAVRARDLNGNERSNALHLSDLFRHHGTFYPTMNIRESDGLPLTMHVTVPHSPGGSPAASCMEG